MVKTNKQYRTNEMTFLITTTSIFTNMSKVGILRRHLNIEIHTFDMCQSKSEISTARANVQIVFIRHKLIVKLHKLFISMIAD